MPRSLSRLAKLLAITIAAVAIMVTSLSLLTAHRMADATRALWLSQAQLESALRLRAAANLPGDDSDGLLRAYAAQIAAEDRLTVGIEQRKHQQIEWNDLARLRQALANPDSDPRRIDLLTHRIVHREELEKNDARRQLEQSERLMIIAAASGAVVLILVGALFMFLLRRAILRPIGFLIEGVERLCTDIQAPAIDQAVPSEFEVLTFGFNTMAAHIAEQRNALLLANERLTERVVERTRALAEALGLELDQDMRTVSCAGQRASLTQRECELLTLLLERQGRAISREQVLHAAWSTNGDASDNLVDVYIGYLRRKLQSIGAPWEIETVRGTGFVLRPRQHSGKLSVVR